MKKQNGFTLIELLAVIAVLAIIIAISTPIVLTIVEESRKSAFQRSVELVISATDININDKTFKESYKYTINNGIISDNVIVNNIQGMNGSITYDETGKSVYIIHNDKYCVKKTSEMNESEISEYLNGKCLFEKEETNTLKEKLKNIVPNRDDKIISGDGQLINLGEYGIRYQGTNPNNYVEFNNETWRIIGIVDGKVKLIKNKALSSKKPWDNSSDDGEYDNDWSDASLQVYLNGENSSDYYGSLNETAKEMIDISTWHLRGYATTQGIDKFEIYDIERGAGTIQANIFYDTPSIDKKIGLMYLSDYAFAAMETEKCTSHKALYNYQSCKATNWIALTQKNTYEWLLMPSPTNNTTVYNSYSSGYLHYSYYSVTSANDVRPVLYLKENIIVTGNGDGSENNKYQLSLNNDMNNLINVLK